MMRLLLSLGLFLSVPTRVFAQVQACTGLSAADCTVQNGFVGYIPIFASIFITTAAGLSVLMVVFGGIRLIVNFGDESAIAQGRSAITYSLIGFAVSLAAQSIVSIVVLRSVQVYNLSTTGGVPVQIALMNQIVDLMLTVFNIVFVGIAVYAGIMLVLKHGSADQLGKTKTILMWAVIGALIVNGSAAIVNAVLNLGL